MLHSSRQDLRKNIIPTFIQTRFTKEHTCYIHSDKIYERTYLPHNNQWVKKLSIKRSEKNPEFFWLNIKAVIKACSPYSSVVFLIIQRDFGCSIFATLLYIFSFQIGFCCDYGESDFLLICPTGYRKYFHRDKLKGCKIS